MIAPAYYVLFSFALFFVFTLFLVCPPGEIKIAHDICIKESLKCGLYSKPCGNKCVDLRVDCPCAAEDVDCTPHTTVLYASRDFIIVIFVSLVALFREFHFQNVHFSSNSPLLSCLLFPSVTFN